MVSVSTLVIFYARLVQGTTGAYRRYMCHTLASTIGSKVKNSEDKVSQKDRQYLQTARGEKAHIWWEATEKGVDRAVGERWG